MNIRKHIDELMSQAAQILAELGYKPSTIEHYERTWQKVRQWCVARDLAWFGVHADAIMERMVHNTIWVETGSYNMCEHKANISA